MTFTSPKGGSHSKVDAATETVAKSFDRAPVNIEWLHPSKLFVDRKVLVNPRMPEARKGRLKKIAAIFSWDKFNPIKVVRRPGDMYAILNGAGTHYIVTELLPEFKDYLLPCHVVDKSVNTAKKEAAVFLAQKDTKGLSPVDFFEGDFVGKLPYAIEIKDIGKKIGMKLPGHWPTGYQHVPVLRTIHAESDLEKALLLARKHWAKVNPASMIALGMFLRAFPKCDEGRLRLVLVENQPETLLAEAKTKGHCGAKDLAGRVAHQLVTLYDHGFRGTLLGGTRSGPANNPRYTAGRRAGLEDAVFTMTNLWRKKHAED